MFGRVTNHLIGFKQCKECKFTRALKMFYIERKNKDGYGSICKRCRPKTIRSLRLLLLALWFVPAVASAQDLPPEKLDEISLRRQNVDMTDGEGIVRLWFNSGFGWFEFADADRPTVWRNQPYQYTWFKSENPANGTLDDFWFCERATWDSYAANGDAEALKAASWHFVMFHVWSNYTLPPPPDPITWIDIYDGHSVGIGTHNKLIVTRRQDGSWEWTVRGPKGSDEYRLAASREVAKAAAEGAL